MERMKQRRPLNKVVVALANKMAPDDLGGACAWPDVPEGIRERETGLKTRGTSLTGSLSD